MSTRKHPLVSFLVGLALALGVVCLLTALRHKPEPARPPLHSVTTSFSGAPLWVVLKSLFRMEARNLPHRYDDTVPDIALERPIRVALSHTEFDSALSRVLNEAQPGLFYSVQNGVYVISYDARRRSFAPLPVPSHPELPVPSNRVRHETPSDTRLLQRRVSLNVTKTDIRQALQSVLKQAKIDYALVLPSPFALLVTKRLRNVPIEAALDTLLVEAHKRDQNLNYRWQGGILTVYLDATSYPFAEPVFDPKTIRIDCRFKQTQLFDAATSVLRGSGSSYMVAPQLQSASVTLALADATPAAALAALSRATRNRMQTRKHGSSIFAFLNGTKP